MGLNKCPSCGKEIKDGVAFCPHCGHCLKLDASRGKLGAQQRNPFRSGSILGLIGCIGLFVTMLLFMHIGTNPEPQPNADITVSMESAMPGSLVSAAFLAYLLSALTFLIGLVCSYKADKALLVVISLIALAASLVEAISIFMYLNALLICLGPLFLWEPVVQLIGSYKMVTGALRTIE